jgi:hypothetical protein
MAKIEFEGLEEVAFPHPFEIELNCLVVVNHQLTLQAIDGCENDDLDALGVQDESDPDIASSMQWSVQNFYDRLRVASNNQAAVALVTLLQHWVGKFGKILPKTNRPQKRQPKKSRSRMLSDINRLNKHVGPGPVPVAFFAELENVRDSVIHADSNVEWDFRGPRRVADCYANGRSTEMTEAQLKDAIVKVVDQVKYYAEKLRLE